MDINEKIAANAIKISVEITDKTPDDKVLELLHSTCSEYIAQNSTLSRFQLVIGRVLVVVRERKLFKAQYKTFDRYMLAEVLDKYGISRATVFNGLAIAQTVPEITVEQATAIGIVKMQSVAKAVKRQIQAEAFTKPDDKQKFIDKLTKLAPKHTAAEFRKQLETSGMLTPRRSPQRANTLIIRGTPELIEQFEAYVGDRDPAEALAELLGRRRGAHAVARPARAA